MFYDRKIKYLDYMENGDKVRSAGFVKIEVTGETCNILVSVNGLFRTDTFRREVWIGGGGKETILGEIGLEAGKGSLMLKRIPADRLGKEKIAFGDLEEVWIRLAKNRELRCRWAESSKGLLYVKWMQKGEASSMQEGGKSSMEGGKPSIQSGNSAMESGGNAEENGMPVMEGGKSFMENRNPAMEGGKTSVENRNPVMEGGKSSMENRNPAMDNQKPVTVSRNLVMENAELGIDGGKSVMVDWQTPTESGGPVIQAGNPAIENGKTAIWNGNPDRENVPGREPEVRLYYNDGQGLDTSETESLKDSGLEKLSVKPFVMEDLEAAAAWPDGNVQIQRNMCAVPPNVSQLDEKTIHETRLVEPQQPEVPVAQSNPSVPPCLFEDKWKQLCSIYPHISPFHDSRDYLSIGPADFVILPGKYHRLVANSFLLHGYYNYEHLILARVARKGEDKYYLGVPGNFYDREKQVALMFGFESFECRKEPAQTGDYGYFMMRVEI